jgi:hypothetical protein
LRVAKVVLRTSAFSGTLVGEVQTAPALSWSEHAALVQAAQSTSELAMRAQGIARQLEWMGLDLQATAAGISALEVQLGLRLDAQTRLLGQQVALLGELSDVLRTPAKTRAAERLTDVGELLRRQRWKRALSVAEEVTTDDPNNPEGFLACAWANLGLERLDLACDFYVEAAEAADGLRASELGRQAARLAFAAKDARAAEDILERFAITEAARWPVVSWESKERLQASIRERTEFGAVNYDRAVYAAANGDEEVAGEALEDAGELSPEFLAAAQQDTVLLEHPELMIRTSTLLASAMTEQQARIAVQLERASSLTAEVESIGLDGSHPDDSLAALRQLVDELDGYLQAPAPMIAGRLALHDLLLDHIERLVIPARRELEAEQAKAEAERLRRARAEALRDEVQHAAGAFAAKIPRASVAPTDRSVTIDGVDIPIWVVTEPGGFLRSEKKWHISAVNGQPNVARYY